MGTGHQIKKRKMRKAAYSCDRCKFKKRKCVRQIEVGQNAFVETFDVAYPCMECIKAKALCHTSLSERKYIIDEGKLNTNLRKERESIGNLDVAPTPFTGTLQTTPKDFSPLSYKYSDKSDAISTCDIVDDASSNDSRRETSSSTEYNSRTSISYSLDSVRNMLSVAQRQLHDESTEARLTIDGEGHTHYANLLCSSTIQKSIYKMVKGKGNLNLEENRKNPFLDSLGKDIKIDEYSCGITRQDTDPCVNLFFDRVYPTCHYFDQNQFSRSYELYWLKFKFKNISVIKSKITLDITKEGILYLVWLIGNLAVKSDSQKNSRVKGTHFAAQVEGNYLQLINKILPIAILKPCVSGVQFLSLYGMYLEMTDSVQNAYYVIEIAVAQALSLGLNKDIISSIPSFDLRKQKTYSYIWWSLFCKEVLLCNLLKRRSTVNLTDCTVKFPDSYGIFSNDIEYWKEPDDYNEYFRSICKLHMILYRILNLHLLISSPNRNAPTKEDIYDATHIRNDLLSWKHSLSPRLNDVFNFGANYSSHYKIFLHLCFHNFFASLGLPFLLMILRTIRSDYKLRIPAKNPVMLYFTSAINCSKQLYNIVNYEYVNHIFNGSIYTDINILYDGVIVLTIAKLILSNKSMPNILDTKMLKAKKNITLESIQDMLKKIRDLNLKLSCFTYGTMNTVSGLIDSLLETVDTSVSSNELWTTEKHSVERPSYKNERYHKNEILSLGEKNIENYVDPLDNFLSDDDQFFDQISADINNQEAEINFFGRFK